MTVKVSYYNFSGGMISIKNIVGLLPQFKQVMKRHGFIFHSIRNGEVIYVNYLHSTYDLNSSIVKVMTTELTSDLYSTITFDTGENLIIGSGNNAYKAFKNAINTWSEKLRPINGKTFKDTLSEVIGQKVEVECFLN